MTLVTTFYKFSTSK